MPEHMSDQIRFVGDNIGDAEREWLTTGGIERHFRFGPCNISVRFIAGSVQDTVVPVIAYCEVIPAPEIVHATVYAVDSTTTGFTAPPADWPFEVETTQDHQRICWRPDDGIAFTSDEARGIWHLYDATRKKGLYWIRDESQLPFWEPGSPLRHFIHWATLSADCAMIHAAAVGYGKRGFLMTGAGGSGKSTTTAAAISRGWSTTGDDFILVNPHAEATAYPIFDVMKLTGHALKWFADLAGRAINQPSGKDEKTLIPLSAVAGDRFTERLSVHAVLSLELTGAETSVFEPMSKTQAVAALAPSTMNILRTGMPETLAACSAIARNLPTIKFKVGRNPFEAVSALQKLAEGDQSVWQQFH